MTRNGWLTLIVGTVLLAVAAYCTQPTVTTVVVEATPTERIPATVLPASPFVFATMSPAPSPPPELILVTATTREPTETTVPPTVTPTETPRAATPTAPVQRG